MSASEKERERERTNEKVRPKWGGRRVTHQSFRACQREGKAVDSHDKGGEGEKERKNSVQSRRNSLVFVTRFSTTHRNRKKFSRSVKKKKLFFIKLYIKKKKGIEKTRSALTAVKRQNRGRVRRLSLIVKDRWKGNT